MEIQEAKEVREAKEGKDKTFRTRLPSRDFSVALPPALPLLPSPPRLPRIVLATRFAESLVFLGAILAFSSSAFAQTAQKTETPQAPAAAPALSHDLSGVWMQYPDGPAPGVPGMNAVDQRFRPPFTPWGQARFDAARPMQGPTAVAGQENAPTLHCDPDGPPRVLNLPNPFEIIQIPGRVLMFFELGHVWRTIWTDGRALPKDPDPTWLGYSVGKWDGDTFVVETIGFNDKLWVDVYGSPRSDRMHLTERYRRLNHDTLEMQITMDDPKAYTTIWVNPPKLHKLEPTWEIAEWFCVIEEENTYSEEIRKPAGGISTAPGK
jgi:hypothetical protein